MWRSREQALGAARYRKDIPPSRFGIPRTRPVSAARTGWSAEMTPVRGDNEKHARASERKARDARLMAERKHRNNGSYFGLGPCRIPLGYGYPGCADPGACNYREHAVDRRAAPCPVSLMSLPAG